jgi:hypothetical protein
VTRSRSESQSRRLPRARFVLPALVVLLMGCGGSDDSSDPGGDANGEAYGAMASTVTIKNLSATIQEVVTVPSLPTAGTVTLKVQGIFSDGSGFLAASPTVLNP